MSTLDQHTPDPCTNRVIDKYKARVARGIEKYGTTLHDNPEQLVARLRHIQEELMDGAAYCEWAIDAVHHAVSYQLNRRVDIENKMFRAASGQDPMPDAATLRAWALALGTGEGISKGSTHA